MTRGRFLSRSISVSEQVDALIDAEGYEAGVIITWIIAHLDIEGRIKGSPRSVKGTVCPLRDDITPDKMAKILAAADRLDLIRWYEVDGQKYVWFPGFANHQQGLRKDREASSRVPAYSPEYSRSTPAQGKLSQGKVSEAKSSEVKTRKTPDQLPPTSQAKPTVELKQDIVTIFNHWRSFHSRAGKEIKRNSTEWKLIAARIAEGFSVQDLCDAVDGCHRSEYHCGKNERGKRYQSLELIVRDRKHVTDFIETAQQGDLRPTEPGKKRTWVDATRELIEEADANDAAKILTSDGAAESPVRLPADRPRPVEVDRRRLLQEDGEV